MSSESDLLEFACPHCNSVVQASPEFAGQRIACQHCQKQLKVPGSPRGISAGNSSSAADRSNTPVLASPPLGSDPTQVAPSQPAPLDDDDDELIVETETSPSGAAEPTPSGAMEASPAVASGTTPPDTAPSKPVAAPESGDDDFLDVLPDAPRPLGEQTPLAVDDDDEPSSASPMEDETPVVTDGPAPAVNEYGLADLAAPKDLFGSPADPNKSSESGMYADTSDSAKSRNDDSVDSASPSIPANVEFRVVCPVCDSVSYARYEQIGTSIKCEDCFSAIPVHQPDPEDISKSTASSARADQVNDGDELRIEDPVEKTHVTTQFQFDLPDQPPSHGTDDRQQAGGPAAAASPPASTGPTQTAASSDGETTDDVRGVSADESADRREAISFREIVLDSIKVFNSMPVWLAMMTLSVGLVIFLACFGLATTSGEQWRETRDGMPGILALVGVFIGGPVGAFVALGFGVVATSIVQSAASGQRKIENWPEYDLVEWFGYSFQYWFPAFVAYIPGMIIGLLSFLAMGYPAAFGLSQLSFFFILPVVMTSALINGSPFKMANKDVFQSLSDHKQVWGRFMGFAAICTVLALLLGIMMGLRIAAVGLFAGPLWIALMLCYFRAVGTTANVVGNLIDREAAEKAAENGNAFDGGTA